MLPIGKKVKIIGCGVFSECRKCPNGGCTDGLGLGIIASNCNRSFGDVIYGVAIGYKISYRLSRCLKVEESEKFKNHKQRLMEYV